ncbi:protein of unknown function [Pseudomonas marincola]|uniref:Uncharacterized protein n=1 Tax=Pseudomonas marincola TaxID=437900 RepID=A0A8S2B9E0_9PSED|nr:protein of unknown function [Pseudomonas marincola]
MQRHDGLRRVAANPSSTTRAVYVANPSPSTHAVNAEVGIRIAASDMAYFPLTLSAFDRWQIIFHAPVYVFP